MRRSQKGCRILGVPRGNAPPLLQFQKSILNQVPKAVEIFVILPLLNPVFSGWNHNLHARILRQINDFIAVIAFVRNQIACVYPFNKLASLGTIRCGTRCNKYSDWVTMRIHGQMYL